MPLKSIQDRFRMDAEMEVLNISNARQARPTIFLSMGKSRVIVTTHSAIPLSHNALPTELSRYPIVLYPLSYPAIP